MAQAWKCYPWKTFANRESGPNPTNSGFQYSNDIDLPHQPLSQYLWLSITAKSAPTLQTASHGHSCQRRVAQTSQFPSRSLHINLAWFHISSCATSWARKIVITTKKQSFSFNPFHFASCRTVTRHWQGVGVVRIEQKQLFVNCVRLPLFSHYKSLILDIVTAWNSSG